MKPEDILNRFVSKASQKSRGFAVWFLPHSHQIYALVHENGSLKFPGNFHAPDGLTGFVFAPFVVDDANPVIFLQAERTFEGFDAIEKYSTNYNAGAFTFLEGTTEKLRSTPKTEYLSGCQTIIDRIRKGEAGKVVYSRIKIVPNDGQKNPAALLLNLHIKYPGAFCYLFYSPPTGLWMGASPEILLRKSGETIQTIALAGTRKCDSENISIVPWPEKEIREQQIVSEFIKSKLEKLGINNLQISKPYTYQAGTIEHIRTDFTFKTENQSDILTQIIEALHPTPAVCGQPKTEALQIIVETEKHQREYYTGFLGPVNQDKKTDLFVNLRCMKMNGSNFALFIGGGITSDSVAENEWRETVLKADILGQVLGKN
ncbi:MAG: chorismate-binding protein [Bacteroidales bacterium]|nr:chorismate-binding protein [Bacteroidales bacterium]